MDKINWIKITSKKIPKEGEEVLIYYKYTDGLGRVKETFDRAKYIISGTGEKMWVSVNFYNMEPTHYAHINKPE